MVYRMAHLLARQEGVGDGSDPQISETPTSPLDPSPSSAPHHPPGGVPEIGGSTTGFVVLVVALSSFILISCIGIFVLLQRHKADPFERHARRVLSGQRSQTMYEMPLGPKGMREKFRGLLKLGKTKREGWVRANSAEETWDASEDLLPRDTRSSHSLQDSREMRWVSGTPPSHHKSHITRSETSESIQLSAPNPRDSLKTLVTDFPDTSKKSYIDPFSTSPTSILSREEIHQSLPPSLHENPNGTRPAPLFVNGTRFRESLDF